MELMEDGTTIEQQMFAMATEKKVPLYGVLELLPLCNLNCRDAICSFDRWRAAVVSTFPRVISKTA